MFAGRLPVGGRAPLGSPQARLQQDLAALRRRGGARAALGAAAGALDGPADRVFVNGRILTMATASPEYVEAVAVKDGVIVAVGEERAVRAAWEGDGTVVDDLLGRCLLPGFIDPHAHFVMAIDMTTQVNVSVPPVGPCDTVERLQKELKDFKTAHDVEAGTPIVGYGYDGTGLTGVGVDGEVTAEQLDDGFEDIPVILIHVSGHGCVLNSAALAHFGISKDTPTPDGGVIARKNEDKPYGDPAGLLMETAYMTLVLPGMPQLTTEQKLELMHDAQQMWAQEGYTSAQDGASDLPSIKLFKEAARRDLLEIDLVCLPSIANFVSDEGITVDSIEDALAKLQAGGWDFGVVKRRLKLQGIKFLQDGSPQGKTAYLTKPFLTGGPGGEDDWHGEPTQASADFIAQVLYLLRRKQGPVQVFCHANGDAAIDDLLEAVRQAGLDAADDHRTVVIHSQFQRPDHLQAYKELGLTPSYFTNHCFFWGDVHAENIGRSYGLAACPYPVADFISPVQACLDKGVPYSNHTDFNVTPLDAMFVLWTAMARETRDESVLGEDQRVSAYDALKGLTTGPAYQLFEEGRRGSIQPLLLADFVVLDKDPVQLANTPGGVAQVKDIAVLRTIKEGVVIYDAGADGAVSAAARKKQRWAKFNPDRHAARRDAGCPSCAHAKAALARAKDTTLKLKGRL